MNIGKRRELFVDTYLIERLQDTRLKLQTPRPAGIAIHFDRPWEGRHSGYVTVLKDQDVYRMYYRGLPEAGEPTNSIKQVVCYAESSDGIAWTKPELRLFETRGTLDNNVVWADDGDLCHNFSPFIDTRPGVDPGERYKAICGTQATGLVVLSSSDGIHWSRWMQEPAIPTDPDLIRFDSQNVGFWSEHEGCYVCYYRVWHGGYLKGPRSIARQTSPDLVHWTPQEEMEFGTAPMEHLYINQTHPYYRAPHIYIALPARFITGKTLLTDEELEEFGLHRFEDGRYDEARGCNETLFMTSRGRNLYDRTFMEGFVRPGLDRRNWVSRCNYAALGIVPTGGDEMSLYVGRHFAQPSVHLERLTLRVDGFVSVNAPYGGGEMTTRPFQFEGRELLINYATGAGGFVQVELQDEAGTPLSGYTRDDSLPSTGDETEQVVRWEKGSDLSGLEGRSIRLRFPMRDADLYSIRFR